MAALKSTVNRVMESCRPWIETELTRERYRARVPELFERFIRRGNRWERRFRRMADWLCAVRLRSLYGERVCYLSLHDFETDRRARWSKAEGVSTRLAVVVVTYRQPDALACLLESLRCQTQQNFDVCVYHDGPDAATRSLMDRFIADAPDRFRYIESPMRFNDWGHSLRDLGIREASQEFVLITNGDNYYSPRFVEYMFEAIDAQSLDVALCDMVHSHLNAGVRDVPPNVPLRTFPFRFYADIGCLVARLSLARRRGFRDRSHDADATYFEDILESDGPIRLGKVNRTLMVHN